MTEVRPASRTFYQASVTRAGSSGKSRPPSRITWVGKIVGEIDANDFPSEKRPLGFGWSPRSRDSRDSPEVMTFSKDLEPSR